MKKYWLSILCFTLGFASLAAWIWMDLQGALDDPNALEPFTWGLFMLGMMTLIVAKLRK